MYVYIYFVHYTSHNALLRDNTWKRGCVRMFISFALPHNVFLLSKLSCLWWWQRKYSDSCSLAEYACACILYAKTRVYTYRHYCWILLFFLSNTFYFIFYFFVNNSTWQLCLFGSYIRVRLLVIRKSNFCEKQEEKGIRKCSCVYTSLDFFNSKRARRRNNIFYDTAGAVSLGRVCLSPQPTIIHRDVLKLPFSYLDNIYWSHKLYNNRLICVVWCYFR